MSMYNYDREGVTAADRRFHFRMTGCRFIQVTLNRS